MQIEFKKITKIPKEFELIKDDIKFFGEFKRNLNNLNLVQISAELIGKLKCICDRCGSEFDFELNEKLDLKVYNGIYKGNEEVFEVNGSIDFDEILTSETELIKNDYHICDKCKEIENFEVEF